MFFIKGSRQFECLSRNSKHVTFVENYKPAVQTIKKNINNLKISNNYKLIEKNVFDEKIFKLLNKKFDLIFLDPPYKERRISNLLSALVEHKVLKKDCLIIIHRNKKSVENISDNFEIIDIRTYGISKIFFCKLK